MYYQFDSRLNMPAILFDDDRLVVGKNEYDYNDMTEIKITKAPFLSTYGIMELKTRDGRTVPVPFVKGDLHRIRTAVQELSHLLKIRIANEAEEKAAETAVSAGQEEKAGKAEKAGEAVAEAEAADWRSEAGSEASRTGQVTLDPYEEMKKLKELLDMEIVTQEEFDRKKKQLLGL